MEKREPPLRQIELFDQCDEACLYLLLRQLQAFDVGQRLPPKIARELSHSLRRLPARARRRSVGHVLADRTVHSGGCVGKRRGIGET